MKFFFDNMIPYKIAKALSALDRDVTSLREHFPEKTSDEEWLRELGRHRWPFVTVDKHIRTRPLERHEFKQANVTAFFLGRFFPKLKFWDQAVFLIKYWPRFENVAKEFTLGSCFSVQQNGKMTTLPQI